MLQEAENIVLNTVYITENSEQPITLEVNAGPVGQTSDMTITLDQQIIADEIAGDFPATVIGSNNGLKGKILRIVATIADTSKKTNITSLKIHLKGGAEAIEFPLSKTVESQGASADYICKFKFF